MSTACERIPEVDAYFAGTLSPAGHGRLRPHLTACGACRAHFDRHLQLAALDPRGLPFEERVGRGLGLRPRRFPAPLGWTALAGGLAVAALLLVARPEGQAGFRARGPGEPAALVFSLGAPATDVLAFRTDDRAAGLQAGRLPATAELAFAYRNGGGWRHLMVFARDELGQIYWYQPPWTDGREDPAAVALQIGPGLHELPKAVSHRLRGQRLTLCALVSQQPVTVQQLEAQLRAAPDPLPTGWRAAPGEMGCRDLEVVP